MFDKLFPRFSRRPHPPAAKRRAPALSLLERLEPRTLMDSAPTVRINVADPSAAEFPRDIGEFVLARTGNIEAPLTIRYLISGRAQSGVDFTPLDQQVTIPAGRRTTTLPIIPIDDLSVEGDEEVVITLIDDAAYDLDTTGQNRSAALTITDDDNVPLVTIRSPERVGTEVGENAARFVVSRTGATDLPLTINLRISGSAAPGTDYLAISSTITIRANRNTANIFIRPNNDAEFEGNETVRITLQPSSVSPPRFTLSQTNPNLVSRYIIIRDRPMVSITVADPVATTDPADTALFLISRTGPTAAPLRIAYTLEGTAVPGDDYARPASLITIPAGKSSVYVTIRGRGTQFDTPFKTVRMTITRLAGYNIDRSNRESYSRYLRIWDDAQGPPVFIPTPGQ